MCAKRLAAVLAAASLAVLVFGCGLLGLTWDKAWEREFEVEGFSSVLVYDMEPAPDGGVLAVGMTSGWGAEEYDALLILLGRNGSERSRKLLGSPHIDYLSEVRAVPAGGYIACGLYLRFGWLVRLDENGDTVWTRCFGDSTTFTHLEACTPTADGGIAAAGYIVIQGQGERFLFLRTDAAGQELWRKEFVTEEAYAHARSLYELPDGGFLISSYGTSFIRTDADGDTLWTKRHSFANGFALCPIPEGGYFGAGDSVNFSLGPQYIKTVRFDSDGDTLWTRSYHEEYVQSASDVAMMPDGGCVVFGTLGRLHEGGPESHALILKYGADGELEWDHILGTDRSSCTAGVAGEDGWLTVAIHEEPLDGPDRLVIARTRP
jgi:hypothetical protein